MLRGIYLEAEESVFVFLQFQKLEACQKGGILCSPMSTMQWHIIAYRSVHWELLKTMLRHCSQISYFCGCSSASHCAGFVNLS